jgi:hypothetical protein
MQKKLAQLKKRLGTSNLMLTLRLTQQKRLS